MKVVFHLLPGVRWPLLIYPQAVEEAKPEVFEELFNRNRWPAAWRNGVFPFHHYHSNSHEVLGVYDGEVTVQFGGALTLTATPGDVIVLPAGTAHKKLSSRGSLGIVGAYPEGSDPDPALVQLACLERDGSISMVPRNEGPRILDVSVADGVQTVRIAVE